MAIQATHSLPSDPTDSDPQLSAFRSPPHNVEAEKALLGAIFANNRAYETASEFLRPEHFALAQNGRIYSACGKLIERGQIADPVTLKSFFERDESLSEVGGTAYLAELAGSAVGVINAGEYGRLVYDLHLRRELINLGEDVVERAYTDTVDDTAVEQIEQAEQSLYDLATRGEYEGGFKSFNASIEDALEMAEKAHKREGALAGVGTGFTDIDRMLGGLHPSDLIILAGRPSMGKTALATNIAFNAAYSHARAKDGEGGVVGFFSLEMSSEQLASRILSEQTNISSDRMRKGELSNEEFNRLVPAAQALHQIPIFIDDTPALTVSALRTRARRLKRQHGLSVIVVDYLQLIAPSRVSRNDSRVQEVSEITRGLKTLAKELDVPVLALSQLSRAVEQRDNKRPQLSDLRESGSIEQDADVVMFLHREREDSRDRGQGGGSAGTETDLIVAKQRNGPVGTIKLAFLPHYTKFEAFTSRNP